MQFPFKTKPSVWLVDSSVCQMNVAVLQRAACLPKHHFLLLAWRGHHQNRSERVPAATLQKLSLLRRVSIYCTVQKSWVSLISLYFSFKQPDLLILVSLFFIGHRLLFHSFSAQSWMISSQLMRPMDRKVPSYFGPPFSTVCTFFSRTMIPHTIPVQ